MLTYNVLLIKTLCQLFCPSKAEEKTAKGCVWDGGQGRASFLELDLEGESNIGFRKQAYSSYILILL